MPTTNAALSVIVLAAGEGKRMHSDLPKVLQPLAGRPLLDHVLETARALGAEAIHVVYGHRGDQVRAHFSGEDLRWALQAEQLGTGHAVAQALPDVPPEHRVLVLCGDVPLVTRATLERLLEAAADGSLALLSAVVEEPFGYGRVIRDAAGNVERIVEQKDASATEREVREVNIGILAAPARDLGAWIDRIDNKNAQGEYYLTDVIALAVADERNIRAVIADSVDETIGINDKAQLAAAERIHRARVAEALLAEGATLADPARIDVRGRLTIGRDVFIDVGAVFTGEVKLGDRVTIGPYAVIGDTELGDGCTVHAHSVLQGVAAGSNCEIGPFARLRPGTDFTAGDIKVGNFVEVKASRVAAGSKMNHLSYVGDSEVGAGVNVGAGTITCNYDGAAKHRTVIGDGAFIGSGSMLVAPVEIGAGAFIASGSTITEDAPPGKLTIARARQTTIESWQRPVKNAAHDAKKSRK